MLLCRTRHVLAVVLLLSCFPSFDCCIFVLFWIVYSRLLFATKDNDREAPPLVDLFPVLQLTTGGHCVMLWRLRAMVNAGQRDVVGAIGGKFPVRERLSSNVLTYVKTLYIL